MPLERREGEDGKEIVGRGTGRAFLPPPFVVVAHCCGFEQHKVAERGGKGGQSLSELAQAKGTD